MTDAGFIFLFVLIFGVLPCGVSGYFISVKQRRGLISGWNDDKYSNPEKAAKLIGNSLIVLAVFLLIFAVLVAVGLLSEVFINYFVVIVIAIPLGALIYARRKYGNR